MAKNPANGPWDSIKKMAKKRPRNTKEYRVKAIIGFLILRSLAKAMVTMVGTAIQPTIKNNPKSNLASPYAMPERVRIATIVSMIRTIVRFPCQWMLVLSSKIFCLSSVYRQTSL